MTDNGSSVHLIFYRVGQKWWKEPMLNLVSAAVQGSSLTHVEIAIGEEPGVNGNMTNVCRIFNDDAGVVSCCTAQTSTYPFLAIASSSSSSSSSPTCTHGVFFFAQELVERTGRNPNYSYLALGCSQNAACKMLAYARAHVGKPFSNVGMARSILWPRTTDHSSFFCAGCVVDQLVVSTPAMPSPRLVVHCLQSWWRPC